MEQTILAGDIGGTNTRLALYRVRLDDPALFKPVQQGHKATGLPLLQREYKNTDFESFDAVLKHFLSESKGGKNKSNNNSVVPLSICLAVAGPVKNNVVQFTNRSSWRIDGDALAKDLGGNTRVKLVNDFLAVGYGLLTLDEQTECITLQANPKQANAPIACIGAGTGLGECFLTPSSGNGGGGGEYTCFPTEGGHSEYAPRNDTEFALLAFLKEKFAQKHRVSVERVVSGSGLANVYEFLASSRPKEVDAKLHAEIEAAGDLKGAVIATNAAGENPNALCKATMELFVTAYGAEAGVAALKWLPYGGLYLTGGLTPKNIDLIRDPRGPFMSAFRDKGRVSSMLDSVPVYAVLVEDVGERGAHLVAYKELQAIVLENEKEKRKLMLSVNNSTKRWWQFAMAVPSVVSAIAAVSFGMLLLRRAKT